MLSKTQNKYIRSLTRQKFRDEYNVFVAEGDKIAKEWLISTSEIHMVVALPEWVERNRALLQKHPEASVTEVNQSELESVSGLQTANEVLLVVAVPTMQATEPINEWCFALDNIQDPGNMGTIIRIADWFGVKHIICAPSCVDIYNPKVVQAAMGSHLRVQFHIEELAQFISGAGIPVLAATLGGENVYDVPKQEKAVLVIGNESKGISENIINMATHRVTIPRRGGAESLNAAVSTGILCALLIG